MAKIKEVSMKRLLKEAKKRGSIRGGSTIRPEGRVGDYERDGFRGEVLVARTKNMMKAEDKLLESNFLHNDHKTSNAQDSEGFVYVLKGRMM